MKKVCLSIIISTHLRSTGETREWVARTPRRNGLGVFNSTFDNTCGGTEGV